MLFNIFEGNRVVKNNNKSVAKVGLDQWLGCDNFNWLDGMAYNWKREIATHVMQTEFGKH